MTSLKAADAKEIASSVTALANEKLKAEKEANAGKKKQGKDMYMERLLLKKMVFVPSGSLHTDYKSDARVSKSTGTKKKQLHVDRPDDDMVGGAFDDFDEYDFM